MKLCMIGTGYVGLVSGVCFSDLGNDVICVDVDKNKISMFTELMGGVAGGAGVDTGEGVLIRPTGGFNYHISDSLTFNIAIGQTSTPFGNVNSTNLNVGFDYKISILNSKK